MDKEVDVVKERIRNVIEEFYKNRYQYGEPYDIGFPGVQNDLAIRIVNSIIPEGTVVLTREKLIELNEKGFPFDTTTGGKINLIEMAREIERKEAAKQSCDDLIKIIKNNTDLNASVFGWTTDFILNMIKAYFKEKYGVEV